MAAKKTGKDDQFGGAFFAGLRAAKPAGVWHGVQPNASAPSSPTQVTVTPAGQRATSKAGVVDAEFEDCLSDVPALGHRALRTSSLVLGTTTSDKPELSQEYNLPRAPIGDDEVESHLNALDHDTAAALREASVILRLPLTWMVYIRTQFTRPTQVVDRIFIHHNPDIEALKALRYLARTKEGREAMKIAENPRIVFIPSGKLRKADFAWATEILGHEIRESELNAAFLEAHCHCLFVDCGGGGAILDSHGRPENRGGSNISTLDLVVTLVPEILVVYRHEIMAILLVSANDKSGAALAKMRSSALKASRYPHTPSHLRNILDGMNQRAAETGLSWNKIAEMVMMADEAVGAFFDGLVDAATSQDGVVNWASVKARMYEGYLLSTILAHLPKPVSEEEIARRESCAVVNAVCDAFKKAYHRFPQKEDMVVANSLLSDVEKAAARSKVVRTIREENQRQQALIEQFRSEAEIALSFLEEEWVKATRDWSRSKVARLLHNICFSKRDDRGGAQSWNTVQTDVYATAVVSESGRMGSYLRWLFNGMVMSHHKWVWIRNVAAKRGLQSVVDRASGALREQQARAKRLGIPFEIPDVIVDTSVALACITSPSQSVAGDTSTALGTVDVDARYEARGDDDIPTAELEGDGGGDLQDSEELAAYLKSLKDDAVVARGDYRGLTKAEATKIVAAVIKVRAEVVTLQIHDPRRQVEGGAITDCRFGVASTQFDLGDVAAVFRRALMRKKGINAVDLEDQDLRRARRLARRLRSGALTVYDYLPEFLSYFGSWFKTNRDLPFAGFTPEQLFELTVYALTEASKSYAGLIAEGDLVLGLLEWQQVAATNDLPSLDSTA